MLRAGLAPVHYRCKRPHPRADHSSRSCAGEKSRTQRGVAHSLRSTALQQARRPRRPIEPPDACKPVCSRSYVVEAIGREANDICAKSGADTQTETRRDCARSHARAETDPDASTKGVSFQRRSSSRRRCRIAGRAQGRFGRRHCTRTKLRRCKMDTRRSVAHRSRERTYTVETTFFMSPPLHSAAAN